MSCFIVGSVRDEAVARAAAVAEALGYVRILVPDIDTLGKSRDFLDDPHPVVLVVTDREIAEAIALARREEGRAFVVCATDTIAPDLYKDLVRSRAGEWVAPGKLDAELPELVAAHAGAGRRRGAVKIVSFAPSKGGVGNTTLAVEVAIHLATRRRRSGSRIALLDLNLQGGTLADLLDVEPLFDVGEIAGRPERLDEQLVDVFTSRHASGVHVFASPVRPGGADELDPQILFAFIDALSGRYDRILLDLPVHRFAWTDSLLHGSDVVVVSGGGQVPALRLLSTRLSAMDRLGLTAERLCTVVGHCASDIFGRVRHRAEIERALAGRRVFFVRRDWDGVGGAANVGNALTEAAPNSRTLRDMRRIAEWIEGAVAAVGSEGPAGPAGPGGVG